MGKKKKAIYLPKDQLRISKKLDEDEKEELKVAPGLPLNLELPLVSAACHNRLILLAGGGGHAKTGVPNGLVLCRLDVENGKPIMTPLAFLDTYPFIAQDVIIHPKYPLQIVLALNKKISICELQRFEPNLTNFSKDNFDLPKLEELYRFEVDQVEALNVIVFDRFGDYLASGGTDKIVRIFKYDFEEPPSHSNHVDPIFELKGCKNQIEYIDFHKNATHIAACCDAKAIYVWNLREPDNPVEYCCEGYSRFRACVFDENYIIAICTYGKKRGKTRGYILKFAMGQPNRPVVACNIGNKMAKTMCLSPCKKYLCVLTLHPNDTLIYDLKTLKQISTIPPEIEMPFGVCFTSDSKSVVVTGANKQAVLRELPKPSNTFLYCYYFILLIGVLIVLLTIFLPEMVHNFVDAIENHSGIELGKDEL